MTVGPAGRLRRALRRPLAASLALALMGLSACGQPPLSAPTAATTPEPTPAAAPTADATPAAVAAAPTAPPAPAGPTPRPTEPALAAPLVPRPPLTPRWAYEPWVWEDEEHTAQTLLDLVDGYRREGIPVGAVIVDSPWQTAYNTFEFGPGYPDPAGLIRALHDRGIKVVLWTTPFINVSSTDTPERGKAANYDEAFGAGYFVDGGQTYLWWKGEGSAIDFFNPAAVTWWYRQLDRAFGLGVDGWKVDNGETALPNRIGTAAGRKTELEYGEAYYRAFYRYVAERKPEGIVMTRPYDGGRFYAPVDVAQVGWVGDQPPDWGSEGIGKALENILVSAEHGYAVLGSDIGGYNHDGRDQELFIRWAQLGALSPLMENGGGGEHRPWKLGAGALRAYRYYAKLHHQLVPYLYSAGVAAHRTGQPIVRDVDREAQQYRLGPDLLVAPITGGESERDVHLPAGARWHDYWDDDRMVDGPDVVRQAAPTERIPLFIRGGAIIPMQVDDAETGHGDRGSSGRLTVLVYPDGSSARTDYPEAGRAIGLRSRGERGSTTFEVDPNTERYVVRIKERGRPSELELDRGGIETALPALASWQEFDAAAEGWYYDAARRYLWARFATEQTGARLSYTTPR